MPQKRDPKSKRRHLVQSKQDLGFWQRLRGLRYMSEDAQHYFGQSLAVFCFFEALLDYRRATGRMPCQQRAIAKDSAMMLPNKRGEGSILHKSDSLTKFIA